MNDEQLEKAAGGYGSEIREDKERFQKLGIKITSSKNDEEQLKNAFKKFGVKVETYHGDFTSNEYSIKGKSVTREEAWQHIYRRA